VKKSTAKKTSVKRSTVKNAPIEKTPVKKASPKKKTRAPAVFRVDVSAFPPERQGLAVSRAERCLSVLVQPSSLTAAPGH
jgi:hypothetical protein